MSEQLEPTFAKELESLLNRRGMDAKCNTPDFILAEYLIACLSAYKGTKEANDYWHRASPNAALLPEGKDR